MWRIFFISQKASAQVHPLRGCSPLPLGKPSVFFIYFLPIVYTSFWNHHHREAPSRWLSGWALAGNEDGKLACGDGGFLGILDAGGAECELRLGVERLALGKCLIHEVKKLVIALVGYQRPLGTRTGEGEPQGKPLGRSGEIYRQPMHAHILHIVEIAWCAASARHYHILKVGDLLQHPALHIAEAVLAARGKYLFHSGMETSLNIVVEVYEVFVHLFGESFSEGGLAAAHISYKKNWSHLVCICVNVVAVNYKANVVKIIKKTG